MEHPSSYSVGNGGHCVGKAAGGEAVHPFPSPAKVKMSGAIPALHLYALTAGTYAPLRFTLTRWRSNQTSVTLDVWKRI